MKPLVPNHNEGETVTEIITAAYAEGKFTRILRPVQTPAEVPEEQLDRFALSTNSKGRHAQFQSRRKGLRNRR